MSERKRKGGNAVETTDALFAQYAEETMGKVFYFCLKKTGSSHEAEDLTSEISLCILQALRRGAQPVCLSAYVWQIARNRYSVWADEKHRRPRTSRCGWAFRKARCGADCSAHDGF